MSDKNEDESEELKKVAELLKGDVRGIGNGIKFYWKNNKFVLGLILLCLVLIGYIYYDALFGTEAKAINKCNEHYQKALASWALKQQGLSVDFQEFFKNFSNSSIT